MDSSDLEKAELKNRIVKLENEVDGLKEQINKLSKKADIGSCISSCISLICLASVCVAIFYFSYKVMVSI